MGEVATNPLCAVRYSEMRASDTHLTLPLFEWGFIDRLLARTGGNIWRSVRNARRLTRSIRLERATASVSATAFMANRPSDRSMMAIASSVFLPARRRALP